MPQDTARLFVALYTDADVTADLASAVRRRGYQAQSAAEAGNLTLSDEAQLRYATDHGMAILTYNAQDFIPVARAWYLAGRDHTGIILSEQFSQGFRALKQPAVDEHRVGLIDPQLTARPRHCALVGDATVTHARLRHSRISYGCLGP